MLLLKKRLIGILFQTRNVYETRHVSKLSWGRFHSHPNGLIIVWEKRRVSPHATNIIFKRVVIEESKQNRLGGPQHHCSPPTRIPRKKAGFQIRKDGTAKRNETQIFRNKHSVTTSPFRGARGSLLYVSKCQALQVPAFERLTDPVQKNMNTTPGSKVHDRFQYRIEEPREVKVNSARGKTGRLGKKDRGRCPRHD